MSKTDERLDAVNAKVSDLVGNLKVSELDTEVSKMVDSLLREAPKAILTYLKCQDVGGWNFADIVNRSKKGRSVMTSSVFVDANQFLSFTIMSNHRRYRIPLWALGWKLDKDHIVAVAKSMQKSEAQGRLRRAITSHNENVTLIESLCVQLKQPKPHNLHRIETHV